MICLNLLTIVAVLSFAYAEDVQDEIPSQEANFKFGQKLPKQSLNFTAKLSFKYETTEKKSIGVYDKLLSRSMFEQLRPYLTSETDAWTFNNYDPEGSNLQKTPDNAPWTNNREPFGFSHTKLCRRLIRAVQHRFGLKEKLYPYQVQGKIIRRGDHTIVASDSNVEGEYSATIFMNTKWHKNHYGELYFYDEAKEIIAGVTPHGGRVVVWDSTILKLNRPPGVSFKQGQLIFHVIFTKLKDKMLEHSKTWHEFRKERDEAYKSWHLPDFELPETMDISKHVVRNYTTKQDYKIYVFDNLFPKAMLDHIRAFVLKYGSYFYDDSLDDDTSDNVQWIAGFPMQDYVKGAYWKIVKQVAAFATGRKTYFPYDVSMNLIRNADHTKIHEDCSPTENEWTFLLYLTPNWTQNYYGETVFLDRNSDDTDIAAEVLPKYGRATIFQGNIPHSARPPSLNYTGVRLSFASKLSETEFLGRQKNIVEELRHFNGLDGTLSETDEYKQFGKMATKLGIDISQESEDSSKAESINLEEMKEFQVMYADIYGSEDDDGDGERPPEGEEDGPGGKGTTEEDGPEGEGKDSEDDEEEESALPKVSREEERRSKYTPKQLEKFQKLLKMQEQREEEDGLPPIAKGLRKQLNILGETQIASEVVSLYDKMASLRSNMRSKAREMLTERL